MSRAEALVIQMHAAIVLSQDILDYAPLFSEIADAYFERELFGEALGIYELLGCNETVCLCSLFILIAEKDLPDE
jgi:general transcription factor 3C polypeptide 3 (transcription factor C subunit 4)